MQVWQRRSGGRISRRRLRLRRPCLPGLAAAGPATTAPLRGPPLRGRARLPSRPSRLRPPRSRVRAAPRGLLSRPREPPAPSAPAARPQPAAPPWSRSRCRCSCRSCSAICRSSRSPISFAHSSQYCGYGLAGLAAHRPRELAAALVGPGSLAARSAAGALDVPQRGEDRRRSSRTSGAAPWARACPRGRRPADRSRTQVQVFLHPEVRQRTSRSAMAPKSLLHLSHIRRGGSFGSPWRRPRSARRAGQVHFCWQPLMPQRTGRSFNLPVDALALRAARGRQRRTRRRERLR